MSSRRTGTRHRHRLGALLLVMVVAGAGTACHDGASDSSSSTTAATVNFTGSGTASLELGGTIASFSVACESTGLGGKGVLLISGAGTQSTSEGSGGGLQVQVDFSAATAKVDVNLGSDPAEVVEANDMAVTVENGTLQASGTFTNLATGQPAGDGSLTVEGCTPG